MGAGVAGGDNVEDACVVRGLGEQAESERARLRGVVRVVGAGGGFEREVACERGRRGFGGVEQRGDGAGGLVGADVEVSGGADDSEDARVGGVDGVDDAGGSGDVVVRFERTGERVLKLDLLHGVGSERGLLGEGALVYRDEAAGLGKSADGCSLVEG